MKSLIYSKFYLIILIPFIPLWVAMYYQYKDINTITYVRDKSEVITAEITAYTSSIDETDDTPTLMANGTQTRRGVIACPSKYSFGTKVIIGSDEYICADRMNKRYRDKNHFDIWVESKHEAYEWGRRTLSIKIIN